MLNEWSDIYTFGKFRSTSGSMEGKLLDFSDAADLTTWLQSQQS